VKLYSFWRSTCSWRARIVLHYKGIPYDYVAVNLSPGAAESELDHYAGVNALRQVPTLEWTDGGRIVRLTQSVAIAEYLEESHPHPPLFPADPLARARVRQAVEIVNSGIQPHQNSRTFAALRRLTDESRVSEYVRGAIGLGLGALEVAARAESGRFMVGDSPTLADVFLVPQLYNARRFDVDVAPFPKLAEIADRAAVLPAFARAHPDSQPDAPGKGAPS
jgi:maleylpyruvate isomerase